MDILSFQGTLIKSFGRVWKPLKIKVFTDFGVGISVCFLVKTWLG